MIKESIAVFPRNKEIIILIVITTVILVLINIPNYHITSTLNSSIVFTDNYHPEHSANIEFHDTPHDVEVGTEPSTATSSIVTVTTSTQPAETSNEDVSDSNSSEFIDLSQATNANLHLRPPNQTWAHRQMENVFSMLGYHYDPPNNWHRCSHAHQTYYFKKINTIFTGVPKSGCSNWIEALLQAEGTLKEPLEPTEVFKVHGSLSNPHRMSSGVNKRVVIHEKLSFAVVRNPWTRMVSGYRDKLSNETTQGHDKRSIGKAIVSEMRGITNQYELNLLYPTFEEYLKWLVKHKGTKNPHFQPQHFVLCIPSSMYDLIVSLEYSDTMTNMIWSKIHSTAELLGSYDKTSDPRKQTSAQRARDWFLKIDQSIIDKLYEIYKEDFALLNYSNFTHPDFPLPIHD